MARRVDDSPHQPSESFALNVGSDAVTAWRPVSDDRIRRRAALTADGQVVWSFALWALPQGAQARPGERCPNATRNEVSDWSLTWESTKQP